MRLLEQTKFNFPNGDCVRASYASLLGVPLDIIPDFSPGAIGEDANQLEVERAWLRGLGHDLVVVSAKGDKPNVSPHVCHLVSGLSPRGFGHRCVGRGGEIVWDPHPSHLGLVETWSYAFLVPLVDPALEIADDPSPDLLGFSGF